MAVTIYDVAKEAGVSIATVSKSLNNSYTIPEQTKAAVREVADRLGYRPNSRAKNFARQASGTVLFITDFYQNIAFENPHMFEIISGITTYLDGKDYSLTIKPLTQQAAPLYILDIIQQRQADALIIHAYILTSELAAILSRVDFPYLVIGKPEFRCNVCWIDVNHEQAGQIAANYLLDKGYRKMVFVMGQENDALSQSRLRGINQVMAEEDLTVEVICNKSPYELDEEVISNLLIRNPRPEVLLCSNNHLALHCLQHIRRLGLKIPEEIALLTFDNYPFSMLTDPNITAVEVDMHDMGINAARFVLQRIRKPNLQTQTYCTSPSILEREST
ncbi:MAG: LacI family DNA-binding transcriptional regulator [Oscillospiraceae bacterium]|nr:LacI family DNA-binding transcriptional regulator [Oscillospiraceae bacterium]